LGLTFGVIAEAIAQFQGVGRRLERLVKQMDYSLLMIMAITQQRLGHHWMR
jgi:UDP-N-acetylmuramate-alanine ligase